MRYKVYEIYDTNDNVIYVGYTKRDALIRFKEHLRSRYKNRNDLNYRISFITSNKREALLKEGELKFKYNLEWTETNGNGGRVVGRITGAINGRNYWLKNRKLTDDQVEEIKTKYATGNYSQMQLASEYGFKSHKSIGFILNGTAYKK